MLSVVGLLAGTFSVYPGFLVSAVSRKRYKFQHLSYSMQLHIVRAITDFENHPFTHPEYPFITDHLYLGRYLFQFNWNKIFLLTAIGCWFLAGFAGIIITIQQSLSYSDVTEETEGHPFYHYRHDLA